VSFVRFRAPLQLVQFYNSDGLAILAAFGIFSSIIPSSCFSRYRVCNGVVEYVFGNVFWGIKRAVFLAFCFLFVKPVPSISALTLSISFVDVRN
jgi:hypothetical protein